MVNTPIPHNLKSEAKKAAKILREFTVPTAKMGPDKLIPAGILIKARGLAILTVVKAGFLVTARAGSGIVIAKVGDDIDAEWSAPSAIGIAGLGGGFEIGAEVTDFVIILNKRNAVEAFSKGGNLTLGGNFTIAAGPLGRNLEADVAVRSGAAIFTYSKTRGLFAGISVEGSALIERKDANKKFYGRDIRAHEILNGDVERPEGCACLYEVITRHKEKAGQVLARMAEKKAMKYADGEKEKLRSKFGTFTDSVRGKTRRKRDKEESSSQKSWDDSPDSSPQVSKREPGRPRVTKVKKKTRTVRTVTSSSSSSSSPRVTLGRTRPSTSARQETSPRQETSARQVALARQETSARQVASARQDASHTRTVYSTRVRSASGASNLSTGSDDSLELRVTALYAYEAQLPCDLSFKKGDQIVVLTRTDKQHDWWEGRCHGKTGIFPANFVKAQR